MYIFLYTIHDKLVKEIGEMIEELPFNPTEEDILNTIVFSEKEEDFSIKIKTLMQYT